jgi:hypothetical protein
MTLSAVAWTSEGTIPLKSQMTVSAAACGVQFAYRLSNFRQVQILLQLKIVICCSHAHIGVNTFEARRYVYKYGFEEVPQASYIWVTDHPLLPSLAMRSRSWSSKWVWFGPYAGTKLTIQIFENSLYGKLSLPAKEHLMNYS